MMEVNQTQSNKVTSNKKHWYKEIMIEQDFFFLKYVFKYNINVFKLKTKSVGCIFKNITFKLSYPTFHQVRPH